MKKAFLYIRVSTDEQADKGYSQRRQHEVLTRFSQVSGIEVCGIFYEDHSAKTFNRPEFTKILIQLKKARGSVNTLLFTKWDRFSRNTADAYFMINTLHKLGVDPQAVEQPLNMDIPESKIMLSVYLSVPEAENDRRALNVFHGMRRAKKEGRWMGTAPIGFKNRITEGGKKYIAEDEKTGPIIRWIFETLATGIYSAESVLKMARERGLKCSKNNFWNALRNPVYCGKLLIPSWKDEPAEMITGSHHPIISESLFYKVQDVLDGKRKVPATSVNGNQEYPLRGFLTCPAHPGRLLTASASRGRSRYYSYYHCSSSCKCRFPVDEVHKMFRQELSRWEPHPAIVQLYQMVLAKFHENMRSQQNAELRRLRDELARLQERRDKALNLLLEEKLEASDFHQIKRETEKQLIAIEERIQQLSISPEEVRSKIDRALFLIGNISAIYDRATIQEKRDIIGSIFPGKLEFDGENFRTARVNEVIRVIFSLEAAFSENKNGQTPQNLHLSDQVIPLVLFSNLFINDLNKLMKISA